jgi:signal recognition particle GTPase
MKKMGGLSGLMDKLPSQLTAKAGRAPTWTRPSAM